MKLEMSAWVSSKVPRKNLRRAIRENILSTEFRDKLRLDDLSEADAKRFQYFMYLNLDVDLNAFNGAYKDSTKKDLESITKTLVKELFSNIATCSGERLSVEEIDSALLI